MLPEFTQSIIDRARDEISGIHTAMPGKILSFNKDKCLASVLPLVNYVMQDGSTIAYPKLTGVPVLIPQSCSQKSTIAYPIKKGDGCLIIISERSLDKWLHGKNTGEDLSFDLTNAVCIPGLFAKANGVLKEACNKDAMILKKGNSKITISNDRIDIDSDKVYVNGTQI